MKKLIAILMIFVFVVPTVGASGPLPQGGTPPLLGDVPPIGQKEPGDTFPVDLANLPVPEELAGTKFATELNFEKRDKAHEFVHSLTDEQRASIGQLLADTSPPVPDNVTNPAQARQSADELERGIETLKASLPEMKRWQDTISSGLAEILTPEQYELYQDSLPPAPDVLMADVEPQSQSDCYYAYLYGSYGNYYAYYAQFYAYYAYASAWTPYGYLTYDLAYNTYLYSMYGYVYSYYAYANYPHSTYSYYSYYFTRHAEGFAYYNYNMAYEVYLSTSTAYSYYAYLYGVYAFNTITAADNYAVNCSYYSGGQSKAQQRVYLPYVVGGGGSSPEQLVDSPVIPDQLADFSVVGDDRSGLPFGNSVELSSLPVPKELTGSMSFDTRKAQLSSELVRSLTVEQKDQIRALLESNRTAALDRAVANLAQAARSDKEPSLDRETMEAALAEVNRWQDAMSAGLAEILTPEQYELYQDSLLPAPGDVQMAGIEPQSKNDCYYAYYYMYNYGSYYAFMWYVYAYYTYAASTDPYVLDNFYFAYNCYMASYSAYVYSVYAYVYHYNSTYATYAYYYAYHASRLAYWGYNFSDMTHTWVSSSNSYYAYLYGSYANYYIGIATSYAWYCYSEPAQLTLSVPQVQQEQTNWCWAGTSQAIMSYHGTSVSQCTQANYVHGQSTCCSYPSSSSCNKGATTSQMSNNFSHWGFYNTLTYSALSFSNIQRQIASYRPFAVGWAWTTGGGHAMAVRGYDETYSYVYWMDPWDATYYYGTYSYFVSSSDHTWVMTIYDIHK